MFDWLPQVCQEIRGNLLDLYWILIVPFTVLIIILEFFKISDKKLDPNAIIKRVVISMIMLWSFNEVINLIAEITDGIVERIGGIANLESLLEEMQNNFDKKSPGLLQFREMLVFVINIVCYLVALLGFYVTDVLIHFVFSVLYVLSPLLILCYISESTSYITKNLYKGLCHVSVWKILWSILGVLLLKLATAPQVGGWDNFFMQALMNLCIGVSMLMIPFFTRSLLSDGLQGAATGLAAASTVPVGKAMANFPLKKGKQAVNEVTSGFQGTRRFYQRQKSRVKPTVKTLKKGLQSTKSGIRTGTRNVQSSFQKVKRFGEITPPKSQQKTNRFKK